MVTKREAASACYYGAITGSALGSLGPAGLVQFIDVGPSGVSLFAVIYGGATLSSFLLLLLVNMLIGMPVIVHLTRRVSTHYPLLFAAAGATLALLCALPIASLILIVGKSAALLDAFILTSIASGYGASAGLGIGLYLRYPRIFR